MVTQEISDGDDGQQQHGDVEDFEIEAHREAKAPANNDDERSVQHGGLQGSPDTV